MATGALQDTFSNPVGLLALFSIISLIILILTELTYLKHQGDI